FINFGVIPHKKLYEFYTKEDYQKCNFKAARKLHEFEALGEQYRYTVPYSAIDGHLYFGASPWLCKHYGFKLTIPVQEYSPGR
ncbi:unnamed protein product, partial [Closterium sp. NIES-53]